MDKHCFFIQHQLEKIVKQAVTSWGTHRMARALEKPSQKDQSDYFFMILNMNLKFWKKFTM